MSLRVFFSLFFLTSLMVVGQTATPVAGVVNNGGYIVGPLGNGQVAASTVAFASPAPAAGISQAGFAGISDHTPLPQGVQSTLGPSTVVYSSVAPTMIYSNTPAVGAAGTSEATPATTSTSDLSPSAFAGDNLSGPPPSRNASLSLGEVSAQNKARNGAQQARSYTNADVQFLISRRGVGNIMEAANRPPSGVIASAQNPAQNPAPSSSQSASQPATSQTTPAAAASSANSNQGQPNSSTNAPSSNEVQRNAGTTPQISQPQPAQTQENTQQLPATSTILPLLGLIGLATSGVGLWVRRARR